MAVLPVQAVRRLGQLGTEAALDEVTLGNSGQSLQCIQIMISVSDSMLLVATCIL